MCLQAVAAAEYKGKEVVIVFNSQEQLKTAMKEVLQIFQKGEDIDVLYPKYPDDLILDLVEAINTCLSSGYLTGVSCQVGAQDDVVINLMSPRVTASGAEFISEN